MHLMQDQTDTNRLTKSRRARLIAAAALLLAVAMITACGSSSPTGSSSPSGSTSLTASSSQNTSGTGSSSSRLAFSKCMRANGVPNYPDPGAGATQIQAGRGPNGPTLAINGVSVNAPAYVTARQACRKYTQGIDATPAQTAEFQKQALKFSECMRSHGIKNYPDPKITIGPGGGQGVDLRGYGLNFQSPAFQSAANACGGFGSLKGS